MNRLGTWAFIAPILLLLIIPLIGLGAGVTPSGIAHAVAHESFAPALWLTLKTTLLSLLVVIVFGAPLAWVLARSEYRFTQILTFVVDLPIVLPPAVVGVALLYAFRPTGFVGQFFGESLAFSVGAVVLAQVVVSAPFFIRSLADAFSQIDDELIWVARSLGASRSEVLRKIILPLASPGLITGASLAWARSIGEFGATLVFAGNLQGVTQTMPLAIYRVLDSNLEIALSMSAMLAFGAVVVMVAARVLLRRSSGWGG